MPGNRSTWNARRLLNRFPPAALPLVLALAAALPAQETTKAQAEAAIKEFDSYAKDRNAHVRKAAVDTFGEADHQLVTARLLKALGDDDAAVRDAVIAAIGRQRNTLGVADLIQRAWRGRDKPERLAILKAFKRSRPPAAFSAIQELAANPDWEFRTAAAELLACYPDDEGRCTGTLLALLDDKEVLVRLAALDGLAFLENPRSQQGALKGIKDSDWRLRASAVKLMRQLRQKSSVQPLIDLLKTENGRLLEDAGKALEDLTGRLYPPDHAVWQKWWDEVKDGFKILTKEELAELKKKLESGRRAYEKPKRGEYAPYHGIKTRSRNMLFVLDVSASMAEIVTLDERDKVAFDDFKERYGDLMVKIDIAREELIKLVMSMPGYARFNIITYSSEVETWQKSLVPSDDSNKAAAVKWLARLNTERILPKSVVIPGRGTPPGRTNTFEALNTAFGLTSGQKLDKNTYKTDADTMFLLSDGMPTIGRIVEPQPLLDFIADVNKRAKMVIHCVAFGSANRPFMEMLAQQNGGQYVKLGS